ncbi:shikimate dehydrogenase [Curtobacterium sp. MCJR17_055]|uniref:shikimate dehydrogenase family protein n=1 Tax=unclassified Curtobacterium TaxID=257496 RepID=UPI000D8D6FF1|nr:MULTISPECIES: shikimate dehydrogenase [unclassified Curtobacterium]PYY36741.1 shikimate dehydrogenase [Curtobacterium sp. MCBD17_029]PYY58598.1 shikimate dehydrogenase [Curtobacterium sp. MCJR17_055]PYY59860.1 shikimate dehydrogenase [Curtobacterium sp. MCPF17_015]
MAAFPDADRTQLAVLGSPIAHSLSPALHAAAYDVLGLPFSYGRHEVASGGLAAFVAGLGPEWRGLSLTMPLKREVVPLLDRTTPLVDELGVANTVAFRHEGSSVVLAGANTDVEGIVRPVAALGHVPGEAVILGGGATAASALTASLRLGASLVRVFLRDTGKAGDLVMLAARLGVTLEVHPLDELASAGPMGFVVSTLPGGAADDLPLVPSGPDAVLFDVAYEPWPTRASTAWTGAGGRVLNGLDMLSEQAIGQIRFFLTGDEDELLPSEAEVRRAMRAAVGLPPTIG